MSLEKMLEAMAEQDRKTRSSYHLTLGELRAALEGVPAGRGVQFDTGEYPGEICSYRGYYSDPAIVPSDAERTAGDLLDEVRLAIGRTFQGYKGGDFTMYSDSPLWMAEYGACGLAVVGVQVDDGTVVLQTKDLDA